MHEYEVTRCRCYIERKWISTILNTIHKKVLREISSERNQNFWSSLDDLEVYYWNKPRVLFGRNFFDLRPMTMRPVALQPPHFARELIPESSLSSPLPTIHHPMYEHNSNETVEVEERWSRFTKKNVFSVIINPSNVALLLYSLMHVILN